MTRDDEPRLCIHCHNRIMRNEDGVWGNEDWIRRGYHSIGLTCQSWAPGRLIEPVDSEHEYRHFPGILIADPAEIDWEAADV